MPRELAIPIAGYWFYGPCPDEFVMAILAEVGCSKAEPRSRIAAKEAFENHSTIIVLSASQSLTSRAHKSVGRFAISARNSSTKHNCRACSASAEEQFVSSEVIWPLEIFAFRIHHFRFLSNLFVNDHC
jgi:hypothetical protein